ncbi:hypothetical protein FGG08_000630 [Glutinoglossum americanum]|uniref:Uncharacterized protein n=1 Tax=Glutinoglossum americanum TaxID=1670608 RepID=A0A9P8IF43_9PEZI|nr:hypothetical protein FGG08_000630 [Glutinoglossum americanum]
MVAKASDLPKAPPPHQLFKSDQRYFLNMAEISAAEISEYETTGFVVLRKRVDPILVQKARDAITGRVQDARKNGTEDRLFVTVYEGGDWPPECKTLYDAVEKSVPPASFSPKGSKLRIGSLVGVYQPNDVEGRGPPKTFFYKVGLYERDLQSTINMPEYYERSHIDGPLKSAGDKLKIEEGDILVWQGRTGMKNVNKEGAAFMLISYSWD